MCCVSLLLLAAALSDELAVWQPTEFSQEIAIDIDMYLTTLSSTWILFT